MNLDQIVTQVFVHALTPPVKSAAGILDWAKDNPALATGVGTGLAGGLLTAGGRRQPGESRTSRTLRVLRNALLTGALGAGAVGALRAGTQNIAQALPAGDVDPATRALTSTPLRATLGITGAGAGAHFSRGYARNPHDAVQSILGAFRPSIATELQTPGHFAGAARARGANDISDLTKKVLSGMPSILGNNTPAGQAAGGLKNIFEGAGKANVGTVLDELGTNAATREEMLRNFTRAGINTVGREGGIGNSLKRNLVEPAKMLAWRHLTLPRVGAILGGGAAGYFTPDIARGLVDMASANE